MNTDDLIALLASHEGPVDRHALAKRLGLALLAGLIGALLMTVALYGVRSDLVEVARTPLFWAKVALPASLALLGLWLTQRLARPGVKGGALWGLLGLPLVLVWLGAAISLLGAPVEARADLVLGRTWRTCALNIALLSLPCLIAVFWALRGLAPTRLRQAGAAGGLLAGSTATLAYCLHCPEMGVPFWGLWYVLGMLLPTLFGAAIGPRLLRW
ncbi:MULTISPECIES: DUF1109 domain-containing protein [Pseudomonas]|uniref:DUF1109 domain-containing protein n=1 Tax=Pseudomonas TaxID=286 RepID=UPI001E5AD25B|nr:MULTISPECIES: DUF1109 domain-containing protein [Pseudomonas]MCE1113894.1 DUF1109 domain-containing protein [Pseudomonas sp. NMI795_08]